MTLAIPLSLVLLLVCCLPNVTLSVRIRPRLRFRSPWFLVLVCSLPNVTLMAVVTVRSETSLFPQRVMPSNITHEDEEVQSVRWKRQTLCQRDRPSELRGLIRARVLGRCVQAVVIEIVVPEIDILVSSTGEYNISMQKLNNALVRNTGHFDDEIDLAGSEGLECVPQKIVSSSPLVTR